MKGHHSSPAWFLGEVCITSFNQVNNRRQSLKNFEYECNVTRGKYNSQS